MNNKLSNVEIDSDSQHIVFGATGAYGYAIVKKLLEKNIRVRAVVRNENKALRLFPKNVEIVTADILNEEQVAVACRDASVVYYCNNFPYRDWMKSFMGATVNILKASEQWHPILIFPGNVYGYGEFKSNPVIESHPLSAISKKGRLRNDIEALLLEYHRKGRINTIIPRFADFYGPNVTNDLYGAMFRNAIKGKSALWPINMDVSHNYTYIDDAAEATLLLAEDPEAFGKVFHVSGPVTTARKFIGGIYNALGSPIRIRVLSKTFLKLMSPFDSKVRGLLELLYEYEGAYNIDDSAFRERYPSFRHTPCEIGIRNTLDWFKKTTLE